jgi:hypothetical protein
VRPAGEVEQHVDPAELAYGALDESRAFGRVAEDARLERDHLGAGRLDHLECFFRGLDRHVAADDQRTFAGERQGGRASHAPARASDDADLA